MERAFILDATYRIEAGCPVVHLFGVAEDGHSIVMRDRRVRPSFFLAAADLGRAQPILEAAQRAPGAEFPRVGADSWQTMQGDPAVEIFTALPADVPPLREALRSAGIECHEADIPFVTRYLIDRGIRGSLAIEGTWRTGRRVARIYDDAELTPAGFDPVLSVLALDLETDPSANDVYSFALYGHLPLGGRVAEVHAVLPDGASEPPPAVETSRGAAPCYYHRNEAELVRTLLRRVHEIDPDVLTGWNLIGFDLGVLERACRRHGLPFFLGRADLPCRIRPAVESWMTARATVPGRAVLDGLDLVRGAFIRLDDYSLDTAARTLLGEGKVLAAEDRAAEISRIYREDLAHFLLYNLTDVRLVIEIIEKLDLVTLAVRRSRLTGLPVDRGGASIASFDILYITALHRQRIAAPSVHGHDVPLLTPDADDDLAGVGEGEIEPAPIGGYVLDSVPGIHANVWLCDYRSLYPSIILTFHIDPLGHAQARRILATQEPAAPCVVRAPNGAAFLRSGGILPEILRELFPQREDARRRGDRITSTAIKILMNSFYGVLATPRCRFHSTEVSNAITTFGQQILLWTKAELERGGYPVIYGDTDSVFAVSGIKEPEPAEEQGVAVTAALNAALTDWVRAQYDLESHLHLEYERCYLKFFMPSQRHRHEGSKKRYAGLVATPAGRELVATGLELVRRDWTVLAKDFQRHLLIRILEGEPVDEFITAFVRDLRAGRRDGDLVYRKALRKPLEAYGKTTPPHVKAARLMAGRHGRVVRYVITREGPQPVGWVTAPLDYEHYVEKQLRPIADAILVHVGMSFDEIAGSGGQLGLL